MRRNCGLPAPPLPYDTFGGRSLSVDFRAFENEGLRPALSRNDVLRVSDMKCESGGTVQIQAVLPELVDE